jgi:hypothetical protein
VYDSLDILTSPGRPGRYIGGIVLVLFTGTASQSVRQEAVDSTGGVVVGGRRSFGTDGYY